MKTSSFSHDDTRSERTDSHLDFKRAILITGHARASTIHGTAAQANRLDTPPTSKLDDKPSDYSTARRNGPVQAISSPCQESQANLAAWGLGFLPQNLRSPHAMKGDTHSHPGNISSRSRHKTSHARRRGRFWVKLSIIAASLGIMV